MKKYVIVNVALAIFLMLFGLSFDLKSFVAGALVTITFFVFGKESKEEETVARLIQLVFYLFYFFSSEIKFS